MTLGIPEWWLGLGDGGVGWWVWGVEGRNKMDAGMRGVEKRKGKQRERVRLIETREIQYLLNEKDEFQ